MSDKAIGDGAGKIAARLSEIREQLEVQSQLLHELTSVLRNVALGTTLRAMSPGGLTDDQADKLAALFEEL